MNQPTPWLDVLKSWEGIDEASPAAERIIEAWGRPFDLDEDPWCSVGLGGALRKAGWAIDGVTPAARSWLDWKYGRRIDSADDLKRGDIVVITRGPAPYGHVGVLDHADAKSFYLWGCNQNDTVKCAGFERSRFIAGMRPIPLTAKAQGQAMGKEHYDRAVFFDTVREGPFPGRLQQGQVNGMSAFLDAWEPTPFTDRRWLAYCLGTQPIETGFAMQPIEEFGKGKGRAYGRPAGPHNLIYYGRGLVQLTWYENYLKASTAINNRNLVGRSVDLVKNPDQALEPDIAAVIMIYGMAEGWFTGKSLKDYFAGDKSDWTGARAIVNGSDRAAEIGGHAQQFYNALEKAATITEPGQPNLEKAPTGPDPVLASLIEQIKERTGATHIDMRL